MKKTATCNRLLLYIPAFILPVTLLTLFKLLYASGYGQAYPGTLSIAGIILSGLASVSMFFYFRKNSQIALTYPLSIFLSAFYGLSSHALLPSSEFGAQLSVALFPILVFAFEAFVFNQKSLFLIFLLSLYLSVDTITATTLMIGFLFAFFFMSHSSKGRLIGDFCHLLLIYILSICISGMFSLPAYKDYFTAVSSYSYPGFMSNMPFSNLVSRILLGAIPVLHYDNSISNVSLYFGILGFLLFILYFFYNGIRLRDRMKTLIFLCIVLCALEFSPVQYIFELFSSNKPFILYFECILIFWGLKLAGNILPVLPKFKPLNMISGLVCGTAIMFCGFAGSYLNFHPTAQMSNIIFLILFIICILFLWKAPNIHFVKTLLYGLLSLELVCNIFLVTNYNIFPQTASAETNYIWNSNSGQEMTPEFPSDDAYANAEAAYNAFYDEHADLIMVNRINTLLSEVDLEEEDYKAYNEYGLLNIMEEANAACRKIGASADLFIPADLEISFPDSDTYTITPQGGNVYNLYQYLSAEENPLTYIRYEFYADTSQTLVVYDSLTRIMNRYEPDNHADSLYSGYLYTFSTNVYSYNFQLLGYYMNTDVYEEIPSLLVSYKEAQLSGASYMGIYYAGIISTCIGILLFALFFFNKDRNSILSAFQTVKEKLSRLLLWERISTHMKTNYVYYLAFWIPVILYVLTMIVFSCIPFGRYSFYDEDGISSSLPSILSAYYNIKNGNSLFSTIGGYGYSPYSTNTVFFYRALLLPFTAKAIPFLVLFLEGIFMGLSAFSMVYYLTHRLSGTKALKTDYRLLIPAFIYALNTYILAMHVFPTWYYVFFALPILLLAMDYLMYKKSWGLYTFMLAFCIFTNINLSIFVCFFMVIWFFTYRFYGIKDFLQKGTRFAFASLAAAGCNFFKLLETYGSKTTSLYQVADNVFPTFGFHTSFWEQWKQLFIFSPSMAVSQDDGHINIYMGILTLLMLGLYLTSKRISLKDKLKRLIPVAILSVSFNEQILSYIWNGFHYQTNVPNRYVFLLMFLCALISYDAVRELKHISIYKFTGLCGLLLIFLVLCHVFSEDTVFAFVCSLILVVLYGIFHGIYKKAPAGKFPYYKVLCITLLIELGANMFYTTSHYNLFSYTFIDSFDEVENFVSSELMKDDDAPGRISTPGSFQINTGMIYNIPSASFFNSYVSSHQSFLHYCYGFLSGTNYNTYNYNSTPLGMALSNHKYIFLPLYTSVNLNDNTRYDYVGRCENYYIYENKDVLPLGFYMPNKIPDIPDASVSAPAFQNAIVSLYTNNGKPVYTIHKLAYSEDAALPDSFCFLDADKNPISPEEAQEIVWEKAGSSMSFCIRDLYLHFNLLPENDGELYLYLNEFIPLGKGSAQTPLVTETPYPNPTPLTEGLEFIYVTFNEDVFDEFMEEVSKNQLENAVFDNNRITGTTRYKEDGYTMLSLPYEAGWKAYIDGEETAILDPYSSFMMFETPAGEHQIELVYERPGMKTGIFISIGMIVLTLLAYGIHIYRKKKTAF